MNHKLQVRTLLASLKEEDLFKVLDSYLTLSNAKLEKSTKEISYKCFQCHCKIKTKSAAGFGRNETETLVNAVRNLMEALIDDDKTFTMLKNAVSVSKIEQPHEMLIKTVLTVTSKHSELRKQHFKQSSILKEDLFQHFDHQQTYYTSSSLKIKHPNISVKIRAHQAYMSQSVDHTGAANKLQKAQQYIKELEAKIKQAVSESETLKANLNILNVEASSSNLDALQFKIHANVRSISVEQGGQPKPALATQQCSYMNQSIHTNLSTLQDCKKEQMRVPRLKLEMLPNYHGKSNKSLNQSLLEAYSKNKK